MSKIVRQDLDDLNASISLIIEPSDYEAKYKKQIEDYRQNAQMKGFRKGKVPVSLIRKMHGKSVLANLVNEALQEKLGTYLKEEGNDIILQPILAEGHEQIDFNPKKLETYEFLFDAGLMPKFDIIGALESDTYEKYKIEEASKTVIEESFENIRRQNGERSEAEDQIQERDMVKFLIKELEGEEVKEEGFEDEVSVLADTLLKEEAKDLLLTKKKGDIFQFNPTHLEKDMDAEKVKQQYLKAEGKEDIEVDRLFQFEVIEVMRVQLEELTEDFFKNNFGEEVSNEEEAKAFIENNIKDYYNNQGDIILKNKIQERITKNNHPSLPEKFMKRWLQAVDENRSEEAIEESFDQFKEEMIWSVISKRVQQENNLDVSQEEIVQNLANNIRSMYGGFGDNKMINDLIGRLLQDQNQVNRSYEQVMSQKVLQQISEQVTIEDNVVTTEEMDAILKELSEEQQRKQLEEAEKQQALEASKSVETTDDQTETSEDSI